MKGRPSLRDGNRQRARREQHAQAAENRDEPKGIVRVGVAAVAPQRPEALGPLGIHVGAQLAETVGVEGELGVGEPLVEGTVAAAAAAAAAPARLVEAEDQVVARFEAVRGGEGAVHEAG